MCLSKLIISQKGDLPLQKAYILITNNPLVKAHHAEAVLLETDYLGVLLHARDRVHQGHELLSHPLSGSVKPNETPYKSLLLSVASGSTHLQSLGIIEQAIQMTLDFQKHKQRRFYEDRLHDDYMQVDLSLIESAMK